ncbi:OmpA family protein (plasmid) [Chromobacterium amazonense]|uniref:OmpA family protein n=1 Tax=Chromobacterium amazonense TaxID=1382803 RepID=UPI00237E2135|nr:OmpA family protein [Chromobacterium amazonense]MDE1712682.1 OmpA family protein [Chromobacterium amazonense]
MRYAGGRDKKSDGMPKLIGEWGKAINEWLSVAAKMAGGFGLVLIVSYCFFEIDFVPGGLTLADTFLYVAVSLGFGFIMLIFAAYSTYAVYWALGCLLERRWVDFVFNLSVALFAIAVFLIFVGLFAFAALTVAAVVVLIGSVAIWVRRNGNSSLVKKFKDWSGIYIGSVLVFLLALIYSVLAFNKFGGQKVADAWVSAFSAAVPWTLAVYTSNMRTSSSHKLNSKFRVPVIIVLLFSGLIFPLGHKDFAKRVLDMTFEKLGIRMENVSIALNEENAEKFRSIFHEEAGAEKICRQGKGAMTVIYGVNVLWHGFGDKTLVEVGDEVVHPFELKKSGKSARIDLDRKGVTILRGVDQEACLEIPDALFKGGDDKLKGKSLVDFKPVFKKIAANVKNIRRVEVIGYSDLRPIAGGNQALSERRAQHVAGILSGYGVSEDLIKYYGKGVMDPKLACDKDVKGVALDECLAPNRRVAIRIFLTPKSG